MLDADDDPCGSLDFHSTSRRRAQSVFPQLCKNLVFPIMRRLCYVQDAMNHAIDEIIFRLREGEDVKVERLSDIGPKITDTLRRLKDVHAKGGAVIDRKGRRSTNANDLIDMMSESMNKLRKGLTPRQAAANGRKGGRKPNERTPEDVARTAWKDLGIRTNARALQMPEMKGWYQKLAYDTFGPSGRPTNKITRKKARRR